jgi:hypothetical protein
MKQAASIKDLELGGLLLGVMVNTWAINFAPWSQMQLMKFKGDKWERFGEVLSGRLEDQRARQCTVFRNRFRSSTKTTRELARSSVAPTILKNRGRYGANGSPTRPSA